MLGGEEGRAPIRPPTVSTPRRASSPAPAPQALTCVRSHGQRRWEVFSGLEVCPRLRGGPGRGQASGGRRASVAQAPALRQQMRRRREVAAIHAGPWPRPRPAATSWEQRGRGPGVAWRAGDAPAARRRWRPGHPRRRRRRDRSARRWTGLLGRRPRAEPAAAVRVHGLQRQAEETR